MEKDNLEGLQHENDIANIITSGLPREEAPVVRMEMRYNLDEEQAAALRSIAGGNWRNAEVAEAWFRWERPDLVGIPPSAWLHLFLNTQMWYGMFAPKPVHTGQRWREVLKSLHEWEYVDRVSLLPSGSAVMVIGSDEL